MRSTDVVGSGTVGSRVERAGGNRFLGLRVGAVLDALGLAS